MDFSVSTSDLAKLSMHLGARKSYIEAAMRRAAVSFNALLRSKVLKEVRQSIGLPQREMNRVRIKTQVRRAKLEVSLWVGTNAIAVRYLNPRAGNKGVTTAKGKYPRAFMPHRKQGNTLLFQRVGKDRLPVEVPKVSIDDVVLKAIDREWAGLKRYFDARVEAELLKTIKS